MNPLVPDNNPFREPMEGPPNPQTPPLSPTTDKTKNLGTDALLRKRNLEPDGSRTIKNGKEEELGKTEDVEVSEDMDHPEVSPQARTEKVGTQFFRANFEALPPPLKAKIASYLEDGEIDRLQQEFPRPVQDKFDQAFVDSLDSSKDINMADWVNQHDGNISELKLKHAGRIGWNEEDQEFLGEPQLLWEAEMVEWLKNNGNLLTSLYLGMAPWEGALDVLVKKNLDKLLEYCPNLKSLTLIGFWLDSEHASIIANSPASAALEVLDLSSNALKNEGVIALSDSPYLRNLKTLNLSTNEVGSKGASALLKSSKLENLKVLSLGYNKIGGKAGTFVVNHPLVKLTELDLSLCGIDAQDLKTLVSSPIVSALRFLGLRNNPMASLPLEKKDFERMQFSSNSTGLAALAHSPYLGNLEVLDISGALDKSYLLQELEAITQSSNLPKLQSLDISGWECGDEGAEILGRSTLPNLQALHVRHNQIGPAGLTELANLGARLKLLNLQGNPIAKVPLNPNARDITGLSKLQGCTALRSFDVAHCGLNFFEVIFVLDVLNRAELIELSLGGNQLTDDVANALKEFQRLQSLNLVRNGISDGAKHQLINHLKSTEIIF